MKILVCHNFYRQPGGEDRVFADEVELLRRHGHRVTTYSVRNDSIDERSRLTIAGRAIWNRSNYRELAELVSRDRLDVVHFHNTFPLISPAAYYAAAGAGAAVVQTLHNYRLSCANGLFYRDGHRCEDCLGKAIAWKGIQRGCYRNSRCASAAVAAISTAHRALGTWRNAIDASIAPSNFARDKFIAGGLPPDKLFVKPNFILDDPGPGNGDGGYALFAGRLSAEKGLPTLLNAWQRLKGSFPLKIAGDGDLKSPIPNVQWLGNQSPQEISRLMQGARFLIVPSECYETFGRVAIEALAAGTPVIVSTGGALEEIIDDNRTGLHFRVGDADDLAAKISRMIVEAPNFRAAARRVFLARYTADHNYPQLMSVYADALETRRALRRKLKNIPMASSPNDAGAENLFALAMATGTADQGR